ncbi:3624_t:CDS:2, partial [Gigaspora rosea]
DAIRVYQAIQKLPGLTCAFELFNSMDDTLRDLIEEIFLNKLKEHNDQLEKFKELVETTVDFEAAEHHHYVLKVDFNDELKVIKEKLDKTIREMNKKHQIVGRKLGLDTEKKLHFENKQLMDIKLIVFVGNRNTLSSQHNESVFFTTRKLKKLSSDFLSESEHYDDVQSSLVKEDINISGEGHVILKNARHPCLEIQDDVSFIPIDVELIRD